jgi:hypothetical protein
LFKLKNSVQFYCTQQKSRPRLILGSFSVFQKTRKLREIIGLGYFEKKNAENILDFFSFFSTKNYIETPPQNLDFLALKEKKYDNNIKYCLNFFSDAYEMYDFYVLFPRELQVKILFLQLNHNFFFKAPLYLLLYIYMLLELLLETGAKKLYFNLQRYFFSNLFSLNLLSSNLVHLVWPEDFPSKESYVFFSKLFKQRKKRIFASYLKFSASVKKKTIEPFSVEQK